MLDGSVFAPAVGDARVVHPLVQELGVAGLHGAGFHLGALVAVLQGQVVAEAGDGGVRDAGVGGAEAVAGLLGEVRVGGDGGLGSAVHDRVRAEGGHAEAEVLP